MGPIRRAQGPKDPREFRQMELAGLLERPLRCGRAHGRRRRTRREGAPPAPMDHALVRPVPVLVHGRGLTENAAELGCAVSERN